MTKPHLDSMYAITTVTLVLLMIVIITGCEKEGADLEAKVKAYEGEKAKVMANLTRLDQLDFDAFSKQDWKLFNEIHCEDVLVKFPDGHETKGLKQHDEDIAALFVATPDMRISAHPVSFGSGDWVSTGPDKRASAQSPTAGEWTATVSILEATFTKPMPYGDKTIPPTGKKLKLSMVTVAHWKNGCIDEEQLYWDNAAYMQQLGLAK
jgi:hypothetical protein